jgi:transcriptional regulator with GAF, ATPase, and Fis domain
MKVAQDSGALARAGLAALTLIEEHGASRRLSESELVKVFARADELLKGTQNAEDLTRLRACSRVVIKRLSGLDTRDRNFSFYSAVREYEARLIDQALAEANGSVTRAAKILGLTHQTLGYMLKRRHKGLADKRTPVKKRLKSIIKVPKE